MTVEALIARLATLPPQLRVFMPGEIRDFAEVDAAFIDLMAFDGVEWQLTDERDRDRVEIVRLFGPDGH